VVAVTIPRGVVEVSWDLHSKLPGAAYCALLLWKLWRGVPVALQVQLQLLLQLHQLRRQAL
jgi:hypothetical protein